MPTLARIARSSPKVLALHDAAPVHVTEGSDLVQQTLFQVHLRPQDEDVGLDAHALEFLDGVLCRLCLELPGRPEVGDIGQVDADGPPAQLPAELPDGFHERGAFDVADGTADFRDDEVEIAILGIRRYPPLDFVGDVRDDLDGLAKVVAAAFLLDDGLVDLAGCHGIPPRGPDPGEPFVVAEVQVRFHAVLRYITLPVLIRIERTRVNVDVRVHLLDSDAVAAGLEEFSDAGRDDSLPQGGYDASRHKNESGGIHLSSPL